MQGPFFLWSRQFERRLLNRVPREGSHFFRELWHLQLAMGLYKRQLDAFFERRRKPDLKWLQRHPTPRRRDTVVEHV